MRYKGPDRPAQGIYHGCVYDVYAQGAHANDAGSPASVVVSVWPCGRGGALAMLYDPATFDREWEAMG